jgi:hypothetical protein
LELRPWSATAKEQLALAQSPPIASKPAVRKIEPPPATVPATAGGVLTQVDCLGGKARLHVLADSRKVFLLIRDPANVFLHNAGSEWTQFPCGEVPHRRVSVAYRPEPDAAYGTAGEVVSITFEPQTR